jgi:hypothetical protein
MPHIHVSGRSTVTTVVALTRSTSSVSISAAHIRARATTGASPALVDDPANKPLERIDPVVREAFGKVDTMTEGHDPLCTSATECIP